MVGTFEQDVGAHKHDASLTALVQIGTTRPDERTGPTMGTRCQRGNGNPSSSVKQPQSHISQTQRRKELA